MAIRLLVATAPVMISIASHASRTIPATSSASSPTDGPSRRSASWMNRLMSRSACSGSTSSSYGDEVFGHLTSIVALRTSEVAIPLEPFELRSEASTLDLLTGGLPRSERRTRTMEPHDTHRSSRAWPAPSLHRVERDEPTAHPAGDICDLPTVSRTTLLHRIRYRPWEPGFEGLGGRQCGTLRARTRTGTQARWPTVSRDLRPRRMALCPSAEARMDLFPRGVVQPFT